MLTLDEAGRFFVQHFTRSAFRLETLDYYNVESDGDDYRQYVAGEPGPDMSRLQPFLDELTAEKETGKLRHRVHIVTTPLNDYLRFECEWAYLPNSAAGEVIRILDLREQPEATLLTREGDWWLLDDRHVLKMIYDTDGRVLGCEVEQDHVPFMELQHAATEAAEEFTTWWARHPEEHRANRVDA